MTKTVNLRGTSLPHFRIGISGPTVYFGSGAPDTVGNPAPLGDGLKNGDLYIRTDNPNQGLYVLDGVGSSWSALASTGSGSAVFTGNVQVQGEFDTGDNLIRINSLEGGSGISHPSNEGGIEVSRGVLDNAKWVFDEVNDWWQPDSSNPSINNVFIPGDLLVGGDSSFSAGLEATPSINFDGDTDTGIFSPSPGFIGFSNNGTMSWAFGSGGELIPYGLPELGDSTNRVGAIYTNRTFHSDGTFNNPSVSFHSDPDTGMYSGGPDNISFATNGTQRFQITSSGVLSVNTANYELLISGDDDIPNKKYVDDAVAGVATTFPLLASPQGNAGAPAYSFLAGSTTGMFLTGGADLGFSVGGTERLAITTSGALFVPTGYESLVTSDNIIPNKKYVDDNSGAVAWKEPVLVKDDNLYPNLTAAELAMNGGTVDGVAVAASDRILYTNITGSPKDIYVINGNPGAGATLVQIVPNAAIGATAYVIDGSSDGLIYTLDKNGVWSLSKSGQLRYEFQNTNTGTPVITLTNVTYTPGSNNLVVFVNGQKAVIGVNYTELTPTTLQWLTPPLVAGTDILEFYTEITTTANTVSYEEFTGASLAGSVLNTTIATLSNTSPGAGRLQVFVNGIYYQEGAGKNYTVTGANQITFNVPINPTDDIVLYAF